MVKVLVVEDDLMIADMLAETLAGHGYEVCGIACTVDEAVALGRRHAPDLAVIDVGLADGWLGTDIVDRLDRPGRLGILYASGNLTSAMLTVIGGHACIAKPYRPADLVRALEIVAEILATGTASAPFPSRFQVLPSATASQPGRSFRRQPQSRDPQAVQRATGTRSLPSGRAAC